MIKIVTLSGHAVFPGVVHINVKAAEKYAARRLNDPPIHADRVPHIPRKTWREKGYWISTAGFATDARPGFVDEGFRDRADAHNSAEEPEAYGDMDGVA